MAWDAAARYKRAAAVVWSARHHQLRPTQAITWQGLPRVSARIDSAWTSLGSTHASVEARWRHLQTMQAAWQAPFLSTQDTAHSSSLVRWRHPLLTRRGWRIPWGKAARIPWVVLPPAPPEPPEEPKSPFPSGRYVGLNRGCPTSTVPGIVPLNLGLAACYAVRPQRRTYIVRNTLSVVRLPDRLAIEVDSVSIAASAEAWGHSIDMTISRPSDLALLKPTVDGPRLIEITINGYVWTGLVESFSRSRQVDADGRPLYGVQVSGRSRTALLAAPFAPARTTANALERSAAQLVDDELANTGYAAQFDTVDWLVPAGAWSYDSLTPLEAITRIAEAAGAVVQSDSEAASLRVLPRYPASPWDWTATTPDHIVQDDIVTADALQVRSAPLYDAVVVTGEIAGKGVTAIVRRAGEAGALYAPQASDPLINTDAVASERGRNILSDRGEQASIELTLPLFAAPLGAGQTGRVLPLHLVRVVEGEGIWHGLCAATRVTATRSGSGALLVEQTISLERHYTDAD